MDFNFKHIPLWIAETYMYHSLLGWKIEGFILCDYIAGALYNIVKIFNYSENIHGNNICVLQRAVTTNILLSKI